MTLIKVFGSSVYLEPKYLNNSLDSSARWCGIILIYGSDDQVRIEVVVVVISQVFYDGLSCQSVYSANKDPQLLFLLFRLRRLLSAHAKLENYFSAILSKPSWGGSGKKNRF